jgi:hypothetical protein
MLLAILPASGKMLAEKLLYQERVVLFTLRTYQFTLYVRRHAVQHHAVQRLFPVYLHC